MTISSVHGGVMHNLISFNQLAGWRQSIFNLERTLDKSDTQSDAINDYFNCLIECDDSQTVCKRTCKSLLTES